MRVVADIIEYTSRHMPRFNSVSISGYHMHEAGATADQELAFTISDGLEYVRAATRKGLGVDQFAPRLSFFFAVGMNFFMEIAKLRAARLLWATLMKRHFDPKLADSMMLRVHCQTSGVSLTEQQSHNNIVRTAIEGLAALLGGTQSLHTNSFDEAIALPSEHAARVARNTQLVLEHESGVPHVIDPFGGSYFMESLTSSLVEKASAIIDEVEALGGMMRAIEAGVPKLRIEAAAARRQARMDRGLDVIVGVNRYQCEDSAAVDVRVVDDARVREEQVARLATIRRTRDERASFHALRALTEAAGHPDSNLLEAAISAARARATVGEITMALELVFGRHRAETRMVSGVYAGTYGDGAEWQAVRGEVEHFAARHGRQPRMLLAKLGQDGHDRGAKLIATAFADLGFDIDVGPLFQTPAEAAQQAVDNDVHLIGVSTQAAGHNTLVPALLDALTGLSAAEIRVVCGGVIPAVDRERLMQLGVAAVFGPGTPVLHAARTILSLIT